MVINDRDNINLFNRMLIELFHFIKKKKNFKFLKHLIYINLSKMSKNIN